jgi:hypothetical protein
MLWTDYAPNLTELQPRKAAPENRGGRNGGAGRRQMLFFAIWSAM